MHELSQARKFQRFCGKEFLEAYKLCCVFLSPRMSIILLIGKNAGKGENKFKRRIILAFISKLI